MAEFLLLLSPLERNYLQGLVHANLDNAQAEARCTEAPELRGKEAMMRALLAKLGGVPRGTVFPAAMQH